MYKYEAAEVTGGLSKTSKMPCPSYNLPAQECKVGGKLAKIEGSVCANCYALKGNYKRYEKTVAPALYGRLASLENDLWVGAMTTLIRGQRYFRWHDSGDLQSVEHFDKIVQVAHNTPDTKHWLPTREKKILQAYNKSIPDNLVIRLSAAMVGGQPPATKHNTSTVHRAIDLVFYGHECPAYKQGGECGKCRACWDKTIDNVSYKEH